MNKSFNKVIKINDNKLKQKQNNKKYINLINQSPHDTNKSTYNQNNSDYDNHNFSRNFPSLI